MFNENEINSTDEKTIVELLKDTSNLASRKQADIIQNVANAYCSSNQLTRSIEFWDWMNRNFSGAGGKMFSSNEAMRQYVSGGQGHSDWVYKQLQGKGYEWDWMQKQRSNIKNVFKTYSAGDVSNQAAIDVTEYNLLTGQNKDYQMKAYISKANPDLHNTGKEVTVVTNAEKVDTVSRNGYPTESFKSRQEIIDDVNDRMNEINSGAATPSYSIKSIGGAMAKSGMIGCAFGIGTEAVISYKKWKGKEISDEQYLEEVIMAGGDAGTTAALTTGAMIPVSAAVNGLGASSVITIPIAFAFTTGINKIVAPCFGRGEYKSVLGKAQYFHSIETMYYPFMECIEYAASEYKEFVIIYCEQEKKYARIKDKEQSVNEALKELYDSI